ncbi:hypothetical protein BDR26DRAFT_869838 [Obelidium mucronatum]|nr:hypothetical protein BDR26DRAFT_869838 [Obelidium mucronatum]
MNHCTTADEENLTNDPAVEEALAMAQEDSAASVSVAAGALAPAADSPSKQNSSAGSILSDSLIQNPNKAGTGGRSKDEINKIIMEASKNSAYFKQQLEKSEKLNADIQKSKDKAAKIPAADLESSARIIKTLLAERAAKRDLSRVIVHVDMDAFYASVEELDRPDLKGTPMAVGGPKSGGTLCTANYEARKFGVRSAMATHIAKKLCPELVILVPDFRKYEAASNLIRAVFAKYHEKYTPASLDEAYLDITEYLQQHPELTPETLVEQMRKEIFEASRLTASAGIACNRMIAKVCSDFNKPNGQYRVASNPEAILEFLKGLPIRKIPGIGNVAEQNLKAFGVEKCGDLESRLPLLRFVLSPSLFDHCIDISLGIGSVDVSRDDDAIQKGIGREQTASMRTPQSMFDELEKLAKELEEDMAERGLAGRCVNLKLKNNEFKLTTRAKTMSTFIWSADDMFNIAQELLVKELQAIPTLSLRLIGLRISTIVKKSDLDQRKSVFTAEDANKDSNDPSIAAPTGPKTENCIICFENVEVQLYTTHVISCLQKQERQNSQAAKKPIASSSSTSNTLSSSSFSKNKPSNRSSLPAKHSFFQHSAVIPPKPLPVTSAAPCPICGILLGDLAIADKHIGICFIKKNHPDRLEEWKEYSKSHPLDETANSSKSLDFDTPSTAAAPSSRCKTCNCDLRSLSHDDATAHITTCRLKKSTSPLKKSSQNTGMNVADTASSKRRRMGSSSGPGIEQYLIRQEQGHTEKRKREAFENVVVDEFGREDDPYTSSQGKRYEGVYEICCICEKEIPAAFLPEHVNDHLK